MMRPETCRRALNELYARTNAPEFNDPFYVMFRIYKRRLLYRFFLEATEPWAASPGRPLRLLEVGCSEAADLDFILCEYSDRWRNPEKLGRLEIHLLEGCQESLDLAMERMGDLRERGKAIKASARQSSLVAPLPYQDESFEVVICSEVVEHLEKPEHLLSEIHRVLVDGGFMLFTTDNEPTAFGRLRRLAQKLRGSYEAGEHERFLQSGEKKTHTTVAIDGRPVEIYGHINARPTREWEQALCAAGFEIASFGTYESVVRHFGPPTPFRLFLYATANWVVSLLPTALGRHFGATTAILARRPLPGSA